MASKVRKSKHLLARVANKFAPCAFCKVEINDELKCGKLYSIGDIHVHYYCVLLSCCLIQKGKDEEGLFGFLYPDILAEIERSKKHRCSYCNQAGATLGCAVVQCRKQFHLPCGREKNAVSMFHGNYKSFCQQHAPKQKVAGNILEKIKERKLKEKKLKVGSGVLGMKCEDVQEMMCVICYERVDAFPSLWTFWPPCCARDAWFHRECLQRMALSAGMHYLKCPLCNDKERFYEAVMSQGYYVPDRDAAWELEQNAFAEIYERTVVCDTPCCKCPQGRDYDADNGPWDIKLCLLCGSVGAHTHCADIDGHIYVCTVCLPAAPNDPNYLEAINKLTLPDPNQSARSRHGPLMPSRMSLRRTKPSYIKKNVPSSSNMENCDKIQISDQASQNTLLSREELNLKTPKRRIFESNYKNVENTLLSPMKLLEQKLFEKLEDMKMLDSNVWNSSEVVDVIREKFKKPRPLAAKKKIINTIIDNVLNNLLNEGIKVKEPVKEWISPKKCCDITDVVSQKMEVDISEDIKQEHDDVNSEAGENINITNTDNHKSTDEDNILTEEFLDKNLPIISPKSKPVIVHNDSAIEISKNDQKLDINVVKVPVNDKDKKIPVKFSPCKEVFGEHIEIDLESFKNHYLNEVGRDSELNRKNEIDFKESVKKKSINRSKKNRMKAKDNRRKKNKIANNIQNRNRATDKLKKKRNVRLVLEVSDNVASKKKKKQRAKRRQTELSIRDKNIHVNIKWKREQFKLKITNSKEEKRVLKQYVLQCSPENSKSGVLMRPDAEVSRVKRKYTKSEKKSDNLVQTSISNFFKIKPPEQ